MTDGEDPSKKMKTRSAAKRDAKDKDPAAPGSGDSDPPPSSTSNPGAPKKSVPTKRRRPTPSFTAPGGGDRGDDDESKDAGDASESDPEELPNIFRSNASGRGVRVLMFPGMTIRLRHGPGRDDAKDDEDEDTAEEGEDGEEGDEGDEEAPPRPPPAKKPRCPHPILHELNADENRAWRQLLPDKRTAIVEACQKLERRKSGDVDEAKLPVRFRLLLSKMPLSAKRLAMQRAQSIAKLPPFSTDGPKQQAWLDKLMNLPFGNYIEPPLARTGPASGGNRAGTARDLLMNLQRQMDETVYGMQSVKRSILQAMAQWISSPQSKGMVLGIQGPPGTGKTSIVRGIANTLGRPFMSLNMGGFRDSAGLLGHEMTYVGSTNGALSDALIQSGCMNPILYMDEVDKISRNGTHGDEVTGVLVHLTDESQNHEFQDRYFGASVPLDFSRCWFVFSFNDESAIDPILHNRMTIIRVPALTRKEKIHIGAEYLWPRLQKELGVQGATLTDAAVERLLEEPSIQEPGVRVLKARLRQLLQAHQMAFLMEEKVPWATMPWTCEPEHVTAILEGLRGEEAGSGEPPYGMYM